MEDEVCEGMPPTEDDKFWSTWIRESPKLNIAILRDLLSKAITLCVGLSGGSAMFLSKEVVHPAFSGLAIVLFFVATIFACIGIYPRTDTVRPETNAIRDSKKKAANRMKFWLLMMAVSASLGFGSIVVGFVVKLVG